MKATFHWIIVVGVAAMLQEKYCCAYTEHVERIQPNQMSVFLASHCFKNKKYLQVTNVDRKIFQ